MGMYKENWWLTIMITVGSNFYFKTIDISCRYDNLTMGEVTPIQNA